MNDNDWILSFNPVVEELEKTYGDMWLCGLFQREGSEDFKPKPDFVLGAHWIKENQLKSYEKVGNLFKKHKVDTSKLSRMVLLQTPIKLLKCLQEQPTIGGSFNCWETDLNFDIESYYLFRLSSHDKYLNIRKKKAKK